MNIESRRQDDIAIIQISGRMDATQAPPFESVCEKYLNEGSRYIVVDMAGLEYISSMGLRSFLSLAQQTKKKGGAVLLCGMHGLVREVFDMTHVTPLFRLFDTSEAAIRSL
jgi:anti-sigma B factor antagonist